MNVMNASIFKVAVALTCMWGGMLNCEAQTSRSSASPPAEWDGLVKRDVKGVGLVYLRPDVHFPPNLSVIIDPVHVEFSKDWKPNTSREISRHLDAEDLQRIKVTLGGWVKDGFAKELTKGGYVLTEAPADDTIRVSAAIINLYITAPDVPSASRTRTYTTDAGSMTLVMEVRDAPSGQLLARIVDAKRAESAGGQWQWSNAMTNRVDAERVIAAWARKFRAGLDRLKTQAGPSPG
jgi:Protein of unknown function (DUF3313)